MDMHELIRQMERAEKTWPDERPWTIQALAGYLHVTPCDLLPLFQQINSTLQSERDHVFPEDLRLLKAQCERKMSAITHECVEDKRRDQAKARRTIQCMIAKISEMIATRDFSRALNSYIYLLEESGEHALPEEKAQWYEEMGRLCLKTKRHPNEAALYFGRAVMALSVMGEPDEILDLVDTYAPEFSGAVACCSWQSVMQTARESLEKLKIATT